MVGKMVPEALSVYIIKARFLDASERIEKWGLQGGASILRMGWQVQGELQIKEKKDAGSSFGE